MINIQNISDNECFKWCLVRYLHPTDHNPRRIRKVDKLCGDNNILKIINFQLKLEIFAELKERIPSVLVNLSSLVMGIRKNIQSMCQKVVVKIKM